MLTLLTSSIFSRQRTQAKATLQQRMQLLEPIIPTPLTKLLMRMSIIWTKPTSKRVTIWPRNYRRHHSPRDVRSSCTRLRDSMITNPILHRNHSLNSSSVRRLLRKTLNRPLKEHLIQPNQKDILGHYINRHVTRMVNVFKARSQQIIGRAKPADVITQGELTLTERDKATEVANPRRRITLTMRQKYQHKHINMVE